MDLINFLRVLARRIWLILGITALAMVATWLITRGNPDMYKSTALISTGITDRIELDKQAEWVQWEKIENDFNNLIEAMNSRQAISLLSYRLIQHDLRQQEAFHDLTKVKNFFENEELNKAQQIYQTKYNEIETLYPTRKSDALPLEILKQTGYDYESLLKELNVSRQGKSDYLQVSFRSDNPYLSEFAVNSFSEEFIRYYRNRLGSGSDDKLASLRQIMEAKRDTLEKRAKELAQIERRYGIVSSIDDRKSVVETISSYERMRDQERSKISALEGELAEIRRKLQDKGMLYDLDRTRQNRAELPRLTSLLTQLKERQAFGDNSPSLRDSISMLEQRKEDMLSEGNSMNSVQPQDAMEDLYRKKTNKEIELENAKARLSTIEENLGRQRGKKYSLMTGNSDLDRAQAMYGQAEKGYQAALIRYNDAKDKVKDLGQNLQIFERGRPAEKPEPSRAPILIAFSGLASLALCVVVLFLLEYVDLSIRTPSNFVRLSGLPLLGSLNHLNTSSLKLESLFSEKSNNPNLERYKQLLRKLRYEILNMGSHIMLFTSARSGEGKTLTMLSLAYSLSLNDKKILLIDTNFKGPTLTSMLQAKPVLEDAIRQGDDPARAVSRSEFPGIDVIGCRGGDYSPAEVLYDAEFRAMLKQLSESYDYIFMEGAPLNDFADAKELIHFNEKVVSVFSAKTVLKQSDKETIAYLQSLDDKFLGAILNNVEPQNLEL